jgi:hypothetical protein
MKTFLTLLAILDLELWLCAIYPDEIEKGVTAMISVLPWLFLAVFALGHVLAFIVALLAPSQSPAEHPATRPLPTSPTSPPALPVRQSDTLAPLLLGLTVGWWLGHHPFGKPDYNR